MTAGPRPGGPSDWPYLAVLVAFVTLLVSVGLGVLPSGSPPEVPPPEKARPRSGFDPDELERQVLAKAEGRPDLKALIVASGVVQMALIGGGLAVLGVAAVRSLLRGRGAPAREGPSKSASTSTSASATATAIETETAGAPATAIATPRDHPAESARWTVRDVAIALVALLVAWVVVAPIAAGSMGPIGQLGVGMATNAAVAIFAFGLVRSYGQGLAELGLPGAGRGPGRAVAVGLLCYVASMPLVVAGKYLGSWLGRLLDRPPAVNPAAELFLLTDSTRDVVIVAAIAVLAAPAIEELFFRGFAYPALRRRLGVWPAMVGSALLFAAVHPTVHDMPPIFFLGVALAYAYERTGSLAAPLALHVANNLVAVAQMSVVRYVATA